MKQFNFMPTYRQAAILTLFGVSKKRAVREILHDLTEQFGDVTRITIIRELNALTRKKLLKRKGSGRGTYYKLILPSLLHTFNMDNYFKVETDVRLLQKEKINFHISSVWKSIFGEKELKTADFLTEKYQKRLIRYNEKTLQKEIERVTIEFSWRSSHIEGDTYSLLDTERLIKEHKEAPGKTREETIMIVNHKTALDYAWKNAAYFKKITVRKLEEIHALIVKSLGVEHGLRKRPVGIIGTRYRPFDNVYQIREALENLCRLINALKHPLLKACVLTAGLSYIQPFEDGNKRASRLAGNALLLANKYCPLSYRSVNEIEYKKAMVIFYEQHSIMNFKKLFLEQYIFAVQNYFL